MIGIWLVKQLVKHWPFSKLYPLAVSQLKQKLAFEQVMQGGKHVVHVLLVLFPYVPDGHPDDITHWLPVKNKAGVKLFIQPVQLVVYTEHVRQGEVQVTQMKLIPTYPEGQMAVHKPL